jgi:hypothetical protein
MYMRRCTNLKVSVRVGLVDRGRKAVLVLEGDPKAPKGESPRGAAATGGQAPTPACCGVAADLVAGGGACGPREKKGGFTQGHTASNVGS